MSNTFEILAGFLERFGEEVEGRALSEPGAEVVDQLKLLACGNLPKEKRPSLFELLNQNPEWLALLARELKALRAPGS
jgi:hypothetical protein